MARFSHTRGALFGAPRVFVAIPTYSGKLDASLVHSLIEGFKALELEGVGFDFLTLSYHCHVDDARNEIVAKFLESDCEALVFVDADVSFKPESLVRLVKHDRDVVAGVYPKRSLQDLDFPVLVDEGVELQADQDGLVEVLGAPTGFMKIKRHVLAKMADLNKDRTFFRKGSLPGSMPTTIIFERVFEEGRRFSGDLSFCRLWRKMGGKIFVDPEMKLSHTGEVEFSGTLGDHWKKKFGVFNQEIERRFFTSVQNLKAGTCSPEDIQNLIDGWGNPFSVTGELLMSLYWLAKEAKGAIIEAGSGLSTLVMALANPDVIIHCLEHEPVWASSLKVVIQAHDIKNVRVYFSDLKKYDGGIWYDTFSLPRGPFSLALCDGPPRRISNRNLFFKHLDQQIKEAVVLVDDVDGQKGAESVETWAARHGRTVNILGQGRRFAITAPHERGASA